MDNNRMISTPFEPAFFVMYPHNIPLFRKQKTRMMVLATIQTVLSVP